MKDEETVAELWGRGILGEGRIEGASWLKGKDQKKHGNIEQIHARGGRRSA